MKSISETLVEKITEKLVENNSIDASETEVYKFGVEVTVLKVLHYTSYLMIALYMGKLIDFAVIFAVFYLFRCNTGGFHAQTRIGCYLFSCTVIFLAISATSISFSWRGMTIASILDIVALLILSPVLHKNRKLDIEDITFFRHRLRVISLLFSVIYVVTSIGKEMHFIKLYTIGITLVTLLTVLGKIQSIKQS